MPAGKHDFRSEQHSTFARAVTVSLDGEEQALADAWLTIQSRGGQPLKALTVGSGLAITGGTVTISLDEDDTLSVGDDHAYDLVVELATGGFVRLLEGTWSHKAGVAVPS